VTDDTNDYAKLNRIMVPLADLRVQIIELMKQGYTEIPLADLLFMIRQIVRDESITSSKN
jgi:hypothetical protein